MKRYRWLRAKWPASIWVLAERLKMRAFAGDQMDGFVLDRIRDDFLEARYVEKFECDETVTDPFGNVSSFHRVEYRKCQFKVSTEGPGLELVDAPRGILSLVSQLSEATDFSLAVSPLSINVLFWARAAQRQLDAVGIIDSVQVGSIELGTGVQAKALIRGASSVLDAVDNLVGSRSHVIEKIQLRFSGARRATLILTNGGVARFDREPSEDFLSAVRIALPI